MKKVKPLSDDIDIEDSIKSTIGDAVKRRDDLVKVEQEKLSLAREDGLRNERLVSMKIEALKERAKQNEFEVEEKKAASRRADRKAAFDEALALSQSSIPALAALGQSKLQKMMED